jgi:hypothetical protein
LENVGVLVEAWRVVAITALTATSPKHTKIKKRKNISFSSS